MHPAQKRADVRDVLESMPATDEAGGIRGVRLRIGLCDEPHSLRCRAYDASGDHTGVDSYSSIVSQLAQPQQEIAFAGTRSRQCRHGAAGVARPDPRRDGLQTHRRSGSSPAGLRRRRNIVVAQRRTGIRDESAGVADRQGDLATRERSRLSFGGAQQAAVHRRSLELVEYPYIGAATARTRRGAPGRGRRTDHRTDSGKGVNSLCTPCPPAGPPGRADVRRAVDCRTQTSR